MQVHQVMLLLWFLWALLDVQYELPFWVNGGGGGGRSNLCEENKQFQAEFEHSLPILQSIKDEYWNKKQKKTKQGFVFELIQVMPYFNYKVL